MKISKFTCCQCLKFECEKVEIVKVILSVLGTVKAVIAQLQGWSPCV